MLREATIKGICEHFGVIYKTTNEVIVEASYTNTTSIASVETEHVKSIPSTGKPWKNGTYNVKVKVTASSLNVRQGRPGSVKHDTIIGILPKGTVITVGYCLNGWFGVIIDGKQGFISGNYVILT